MEDTFKLLEWQGFGINVNGEYITHLRFADDIVVTAESLEDLGTMFDGFSRLSQQVGLQVNMGKTKIMINTHIVPISFSIHLPRTNGPARLTVRLMKVFPKGWQHFLSESPS